MYARIQASLEATGLSIHLPKFTQRKVNDSIVQTCLIHAPLRSLLLRVIPVEEQLSKFEREFNKSKIPIEDMSDGAGTGIGERENLGGSQNGNVQRLLQNFNGQAGKPISAPAPVGLQSSSTPIQESFQIYEEAMKLVKTKKPFALHRQIMKIHEASLLFALDNLAQSQNPSQKDKTPQTQESVKTQLLQRISSSLQLTLAENTIKRTQSVEKSLSEVESKFTSDMKAKMTEACTDPDDYFIDENTFERISSECEELSRNHFQTSLNLDRNASGKSNSDASIDASGEQGLFQSFEKNIQSLKELMKLHNKIRRLEAGNQLKRDIIKHSKAYKTKLHQQILQSDNDDNGNSNTINYWVLHQLKLEEDKIRQEIVSAFNVIYKKSSLFDIGSEHLLENVEDVWVDFQRLVGAQNQNYLMRCNRFLYEIVSNYETQIIKSSQSQNTNHMANIINLTQLHNDLKETCLNMLKNFEKFDRLEELEADRLTQDLTQRIEVSFSKIKGLVSKAPIRPPPLNRFASVQEVEPSPTVGRAGGFYVEDSELRSCTRLDFLGTSVIDTYASILQELYPNNSIAYLPSTAISFTGNQWRVASYLDEMIKEIKEGSAFSMTTVATIATAGGHWMLFVANSVTGEIRVADTLGGYCSPQKLNDGVTILVEKILNEIFGKLEWNTMYYNGVAKQDDGHSCGSAALYFLEKLYRNWEIVCADPKEYQQHRKTVVERILQTTEEGNAILLGDNEYTQYLKS